MTTHIGHGGTPYDSKAEAAASFQFAKLGCFPASGFYPQTFTDADGTEFPAKPDFFHPASGLYIEFKAGKLNGKKTKANADRAIASRQEFKGSLSLYDFLSHGWNHAKAKQAIVQRQLTPQNFIVVFDKPPTFAEAIDYVRAGIVFVSVSALRSYLLHARLAKAGIRTGFQLRYDAEDIGPMILALGQYDAAGWVHRTGIG